MRRSVFVGFGLMFGVLASASIDSGIALRVNLKTGMQMAYNCSYVTRWSNRSTPVDSLVTRTGRMSLKVKSKEKGIFQVENKLTGWRVESKSFRNGLPGGQASDDMLVKSREKDGSLLWRVNGRGAILDKFKSDDWRSALSVVLPFPTNSVRIGDRWTAGLPFAPGTYEGQRKVVYEVYERLKWEGHDVLAVQFTSEPTRTTNEVVSGLVYVDTKTGMTVKAQFKNTLKSGSADIRIDVAIELDKDK